MEKHPLLIAEYSKASPVLHFLWHEIKVDRLQNNISSAPREDCQQSQSAANAYPANKDLFISLQISRRKRAALGRREISVRLSRRLLPDRYQQLSAIQQTKTPGLPYLFHEVLWLFDIF